VLESKFGARVKLKLIDLRGIKREFAQYHIPECDVYLHSVYTLDYNEQLSIVRNLRKRYPEAVHIAGGPHTVVYKDECQKLFDALIFGDGEESITKAITDLMKGKLRPIYEQKSPIDINIYPYPSRKYLPASSVARPGLLTLKNKSGFDKLMSCTVIFSRGCPFNCAFCAMPATKKYSPGVRYRDPKLIEAEIEYLKSCYQIEGISLLDEISIPPTLKQAIPHLEAIGRTNIIWRGQCRVDGITPEIARFAAESGCVTMAMGVESVWQNSLDIINKKISVEKAKKSISYLKENGIECRIYMIIGLPGEPKDIVERTWAFVQETDPDLVYLSLFTVRPGTDLAVNPAKYGIKDIREDFDKTMHMYSRYDVETPELTFEYKKKSPWGEAFTNAEIVSNYLELQGRLKEAGLGSLGTPPCEKPS
jgi:radical SAM superfamily enzyme YgiQ (UPF0313 family)